MSDNDPRVFFAAERTLLAWVRTALGLVGLGFVVAKLEVLRVVQPDPAHPSHSWSVVIGILLTALGAASSAIATWQHRQFCRTLEANERPPRYHVEPALWLGFGVALAGIALCVALAV